MSMMRDRLARTFTILVLGSVALSGCTAPFDGSEIDGWQIGRSADCEDELGCGPLVATGVKGLDRLYPDHAPIAHAGLYEQAVLQPRSGGQILVVVMRLLDGTVHALGVGHVGIERDTYVFRSPGGAGFVP